MKIWYYRMKRDGFRWAVSQADKCNIWLEETFDLKHPQQKVLETVQERRPLGKLDKSLGKALNIKPYEEK